jgi:hypothetical protein
MEGLKGKGGMRMGRDLWRGCLGIISRLRIVFRVGLDIIIREIIKRASGGGESLPLT